MLTRRRSCVTSSASMSSPSSVIAPGARRRRRQLGEAVERAQQRRLAAAGRPDQREHLALADRQRDLVDGDLAAVGDRQRLDAHALARAAAAGAAGARGAARRAELCARRSPVAPAARRHDASARRRATIRRIGRRRQLRSMRRSPSPRRDQVDGEVQRDHDHQQHERRRVGLLGRVALARRRVVVDVAGERAAGAARGSRAPATPPTPWSCSVAPSRITTIAVSPAIRPMPSAVPVAMPARARRQQHAPDRRGLRLAERVGRLAHVAAGSPAAPRAWRRRSSGSAISAIIAPAAGTSGRRRRRPAAVNDRNDEELLLRTGSARRSRARCSACRPPSRCPTRPRAPATTAGRTRSATRRSRRRAAARSAIPMHASAGHVPISGSRKPPVLVWSRSDSGWLTSRSGCRYCRPLTSMKSTIAPAIRHSSDARRPAERRADAVDPAPARSRSAAPTRRPDRCRCGRGASIRRRIP